MAMPNGASAMAFGYDAWGRQTKTQGTSSATYGYRYGSKLYSVASNFPDEGSVTYNYGGDQKRRQRTVGGVSTWYNWSVGWSVLNEESGTGSGTLQKTYIGGMAEIAGSTPATGAYSYYATDNLGSPRAVYSQAKALVAELDYTPYGQAYTANDTIGITHRYTGHDWDATASLYFAPYRFYNPQLARWTTRDPLGMVDGPNVFIYVSASPVRLRDLFGLSQTYYPAPPDPWAHEMFSTYACAARLGREIRDGDIPASMNTGNKEHCYAACKIESECGSGMGWLAAWVIEFMQGHVPYFDWPDSSRGGVEAGQVGAELAECGADCEKGCNSEYSWEGGAQ